MSDINEHISKNLKALRKSHQLTLEELAQKSGVSKSMLGEIERGRTNPTISVLWKIAGALKTPLTTLVQEPEPDFTLIRKSEYKTLSKASGHTVSGIFSYYEPHRLEVIHLEITPGSTLENTGHLKGIEEYLIVLEGTVDVSVNGRQITLDANDALRFSADCPHYIKNITNNQVKMLNLIHYG